MGFFAELEKYFEEGIAFVEKYLLPIAEVAVTAIPGVAPTVIAVVSALPTLMKTAEQVFPVAGNGAIKQEAVMGFVQAVCEDADKALPANEAKTFDQVKPIALAVIQSGIAAINANTTTKPPTVEPVQASGAGT